MALIEQIYSGELTHHFKFTTINLKNKTGKLEINEQIGFENMSEDECKNNLDKYEEYIKFLALNNKYENLLNKSKNIIRQKDCKIYQLAMEIRNQSMEIRNQSIEIRNQSIQIKELLEYNKGI
jgi:hypothetical protein